MRRCLVVAVVAAFIVSGTVLSGCGDGKPTAAERAFGRMSLADRVKLKFWLQRSEDIPYAEAAVIRAFRTVRVPAERRAVDRFRAVTDDALQRAKEFDSVKLRTVLVDYIGSLGPLTNAYDRIVASEEAERDGDPAVQAKNVADLKAAVRLAREADANVARRMLSAVPPGQRAAVRATIARKRAAVIAASRLPGGGGTP